MKFLSFIVLLLVMPAALCGGNGDPLPPGTGLTVQAAGKKELRCGWIQIDRVGLYELAANSSAARVWVGRVPMSNALTLSVGLHAIVIETLPKGKVNLRWVGSLDASTIPLSAFYPLSDTKTGCKVPQ